MLQVAYPVPVLAVPENLVFTCLTNPMGSEFDWLGIVGTVFCSMKARKSHGNQCVLYVSIKLHCVITPLSQTTESDDDLSSVALFTKMYCTCNQLGFLM